MKFFEIEARDISELNDGDLRELVGRLCEAELMLQGLGTSSVTWGGAQEAADGGLDVSVNEKGILNNPNFIPRSNSGFQVKKHQMGKAACKKEMQEEGSIKPIIADLAKKHGAYIIVSGKDDCSDKMLSDRLDGMKDAISSLSNKNNLKIDFYGRDRIATWLRQHPGVSLWARHKLGKPLSGWHPFGRWAATPLEIEDEFLADDHPCVYPDNSSSKDPKTLLEGINIAREKLRQQGSTVRITGLSGVGKTRFAQALFEEEVAEHPLSKTNAIYADLGDDLSPTASELVTHLIANDTDAYLVLDNCPPDVHRFLQKKVSSNGTKLRLLTIEYDISDDKPEETEVIHLEPSSEKTVSKLVQIRFSDLGQVNSDKIAEFSGGNARVAISLANRVEADETLANFSDQDLFQRLFSQRKEANASLLESAEVLSLVYSFNISPNEFNNELEALGRVSGIDRRTLHKNHAELLRRQLAQKRGDWRAILPHALANRLARRALENLEIPEINAELFKAENLRLFKSCAHRIGYLHDSTAAKELAESWIATGAPLHNVLACDEEQLTCFNYIAPIFPDTVLLALEEATKQPDFASRLNPNFSTLAKLLCHLAYEDKHFDRSLSLLIKFSETENNAENNDSIAERIKNLFSLYLSGTEALPVHRQTFVESLIKSSNPRHKEIARKLLHAAFEASYWSSAATFDFGARKRSYGWQPATDGENVEWYIGFIKLLENALDSTDNEQIKLAKDILASNFRELWTFVGCFDVLEKIIRKHAEDGKWPEIWMAIKKTINLDRNEHTSTLLIRLKEIEVISAPKDPYSEIEAYVLFNSWDHTSSLSDNYSEAEKKINDKIVKLGELACTEPEYLERLGDKLWDKHIDSLWSFGKGLARGSSDKLATFELLVGLLKKVSLDQVNPLLLHGFLNEVHAKSPNLTRKLQERVLKERKLKEHFVYLLSATPIETWGTEKLIELAIAGDLEAWKFTQISYGRIHETISDEDLVKLLEALLELQAGISAIFRILGMRFSIDKESPYSPSAQLLSTGRKAIKRMLAMHRDDIQHFMSHRFDHVADYCLAPTAPKGEVAEITALVCEGVESYRLYSSDLGDLISPLFKNFPGIVLDHVFVGDDSEKLRTHMLFRNRLNRVRLPSLNDAPIKRIISWCNDDQNKIQKVAKVVSAYSTIEPGEDPLANLKRASLSPHIKALMDIANDKLSIVNTIFAGTWNSRCSGSLADILEIRSHAFSELLKHPSKEVRSLAADKLKLLEKSVRENRIREAEKDTKREQRFE